MLAKTEVDPAVPEEAVRLVKTYPGIVSAMLPRHNGRAYENLVAAYCLVWYRNKETPIILRKAAARAPAMVQLVSGWLCDRIHRIDPKDWPRIRTPAVEAAKPSLQQGEDFMQIAVLASK